MARTHGVALEVEEAVAASARRDAPNIHTCLATRKQNIPTCLASRKQIRFTNAPSRHGRMRKCEMMSKAAMKANRAHAEI
jgi:hypothetical protein